MRAAQAASEEIVAQFSVRDAVVRYISDSSKPIRPVVEPTFSFTPLGGVEVVVETGLGALDHPDRAAEIGLTALQIPAAADAFQPFAWHL